MAWYSFSSNVLLLTFLYFIQGLPYGVQAHFLPIYLRTRGVDLTSVGLLRLLQVPWLVKVFWAPFVDTYSTRTRWLLASIIALAVSCVASGLSPPDGLGPTAIAALFLWNLFASLEDVSVDAIAVSVLATDELAAGNVAQVVGYKIGAAFAGGVLALLAGIAGWFGVCLALAAVYTEAAMLVYVSPVLRQVDNDRQRQVKDEDQFADADGCDDSKKPVRNSAEWNRLHFQHHHQQQHLCRCPRHSVASHQHDTSSPHDKFPRPAEIYSVIRNVFEIPGTWWMIVFLLVYKLGEQGALSMLPMYFIDNHIDPTEVTFWTGVVCQGISICGSLLGGFIISSFTIPLHFTLQQMCLLRLLPIGIQLLLIMMSSSGLVSATNLFYPAIFSLLLLTLLSGVITTATFTLMMQCSRRAPSGAQATHYSMLTTMEVVGKLAFTSACGWLTDVAGYRFLFLLFAVLSAAVLPILNYFPNTDNTSEELTTAVDCESSSNKLD